MTKRTKISQRVRSELLISNRHACCVCGGGGVQLHHINGNPADHRTENLASLCVPHHDLATAPAGLTARLKDSEIRTYKQQWEIQCEKRAELLARGRTAFFMVDYKNCERLRQLFGQLSATEIQESCVILKQQLLAEDPIRRDQGHGASIEPTLMWNSYVEELLAEMTGGGFHPARIRDAVGHPKDPLFPSEFDGFPPSFVIYDVWCQLMARVLVVARRVQDLNALVDIEDVEHLSLRGNLASFVGEVRGDIYPPDLWEERPISRAVLTVRGKASIWEISLNLKTHYVYSSTAALSLDHGQTNGLLLLRSATRMGDSDPPTVHAKCTPLIGSGQLDLA